MRKVLIANRGEIAVRIARGAADAGLASVAVYSADDAAALHVRLASETYALDGSGVAAYLDGEQLLRAAHAHGCDALHPGYGFLSENAPFARACAAAGITFVGPTPETLELFGDKGRARELARACGVPIPAGTFGPTTLAGATAFFETHARDGIMLKAVAGGGGRGMRLVRQAEDLAAAYDRAASEAQHAFGNGSLYVERFVARARHIEVQVVADSGGAVAHLYERDCSLQRRNQKLVEIAPAPALGPALREALYAAALELARAAAFRNVGTFEFLVDADGGDDATFVFIEANPRLQVEHTVTEEVTGIDLVGLQFALAAGRSLAELDLDERRRTPRGFAIQLRVNMETMLPSGDALPASGTLAAFDVPAGHGVRVDTCGYTGYATNPAFDSLLAKVIVSSDAPAFAAAVGKASRALRELRVAGVRTNAPFLAALLESPEVVAGAVTTRFVDEHVARIIERQALGTSAPLDDSRADGLALDDAAGDGVLAVRAPLQGRVVAVDVAPGDAVRAGGQLAVIDAMKMEHVIDAPQSGVIERVSVRPGDIVAVGHILVSLHRTADGAVDAGPASGADPGAVRPDLAAVLERHEVLTDAARASAVARRHATGLRTVRENIAQLCDDGTFVEYGGLALPAQRRRRSLDELIATGQADGLVTGFGDVNGALFAERARCLILAYDYMVLAGTQGAANHHKMDRMLALAERHRTPIVLFAEGGGGRPGDTDVLGVAHLDVMSFSAYARLSGLVPRVGIVAGRCFAGNAALLGASDVIIATAGATIGMAARR